MIHSFSKSLAKDSDLQVHHRFITHRFSVFEASGGSMPLRLVPPAIALVDCLTEVRDGYCEWWVPELPEWTPQQIRSVQVIDSFRRFVRFHHAEVLAACTDRFDKDEFLKLWQLSALGVDSPPETYLRLSVLGLATWQTQYAFRRSNGSLITRADLAAAEHRLALFYDGAPHLQRQQHDYDSEVVQELIMLGWHPVRITRHQMRTPLHFRNRIARLLQRLKSSPSSNDLDA
ncbi:hypothetical protein WG915_11060 [Corynebacterium sp. H128]|uniref:hypothetical protein n=1 Tax=Corynebacterium sp. H128 TaxID=3133427 RepID=UPI0030B5B0EA